MAGPISEITLFLTSTTAVRLPSPLWQLINCSATTSNCTFSQRPRISSISFQGVMWVPRHFGKILYEPSLTKMASLFPHSCSRSLSICQESSVPIYFYNSSLSFLFFSFACLFLPLHIPHSSLCPLLHLCSLRHIASPKSDMTWVWSSSTRHYWTLYYSQCKNCTFFGNA